MRPRWRLRCYQLTAAGVGVVPTEVLITNKGFGKCVDCGGGGSAGLSATTAAAHPSGEKKCDYMFITNLFAWGVWGRVYRDIRPPFGARGRSSVRYGTRLGDLKNKHSKHTPSYMIHSMTPVVLTIPVSLGPCI